MKIQRIQVTIEPWSFAEHEDLELRIRVQTWPDGEVNASKIVRRSDIVPLFDMIMNEAREEIRRHLVDDPAARAQ